MRGIFVIFGVVSLAVGTLSPQVTRAKTWDPAGGSSQNASSKISAGGLCTANSSPTSLVVTKLHHHQNPKYTNAAPFRRTAPNGAAVRKLYGAICSLRPPHGTLISCGADVTVVYRLAFFNGRIRILRVTAPADGCSALFRGTRAYHGQGYLFDHIPFWPLLAAALRMPEGNLFPRLGK